MTMKGYPMTETNNLGFIENLAAQIDYSDGSTAVSYTHLTLPTKRIV